MKKMDGKTWKEDLAVEEFGKDAPERPEVNRGGVGGQVEKQFGGPVPSGGHVLGEVFGGKWGWLWGEKCGGGF